jgi:hypothetical protein
VAEDFDERLSQVERALRVINTIEKNPDLQAAAFSHLFGTAPSLRSDAVEESPDGEDESNATGAGETADAAKKNAGSKKPRKPPTPVAQDKSLQIAPAGKTSWADFVAEKKPSSMNDKYAVCVYWLLDVAELPKATVNQIVSLFIAAKWVLPKDPRNACSQAGRAGFLDSKSQQDIKMTSLGTAHVLNDLPAK